MWCGAVQCSHHLLLLLLLLLSSRVARRPPGKVLLPSAILLLLLQQFLVQLVRLSLCLILHLLLLGLLADTPGADLSPVSDPDLIRG